MKSISPKNQEEDNKSVNIIGKALAEKMAINGTKQPNTSERAYKKKEKWW